MSAEIYSIEKKNYYKTANIVAVIGGIISCLLVNIPIALFSSYNTLYCLYRSLYANATESTSGQEVIKLELLFTQCQDTWNFFVIGISVFVGFVVIYLIVIGSLYLSAYFKANRNK